MSATISDIYETQSSLLQEASEALPYQFSQCTYSKGYIRQAIYLCLTCKEPRGICSACSVACHTDHEQVELFPKRHFRCDCPTSALPHPCSLHTTLEEENTENKYGQNFEGAFCRCGRPYDAQSEKETMIQCLSCEDWFHESCLNLRERPSSRAPSPPARNSGQQDADYTGAHDDASSETSSDALPPPLITADMYEALVCAACVRRIDILQRWAGTPGVLMVVRDGSNGAWQIMGNEDNDREDLQIDTTATAVGAGKKRARSGSIQDELQSKRFREDDATSSGGSSSQIQRSPCVAPPPNPRARGIYTEASSSDNQNRFPEDGTGDVFLTEGFRERWCRCETCERSLREHPYLLEEEETYEPPEDPDSGLSLEELGMRALQRLPRDKAIDGIRAFNEMRDQLMSHLRPFAQEGREVTEADIKSFFDSKLTAKTSS
ncbi:hypothetical protein K474DRAFT_1668856 [Panus rudis PR-1116 ss-1]|nr:hypothetical protein K474DRAFT_1668856 [Panus rudis PR-1116 ss-1]